MPLVRFPRLETTKLSVCDDLLGQPISSTALLPPLWACLSPVLPASGPVEVHYLVSSVYLESQIGLPRLGKWYLVWCSYWIYARCLLCQVRRSHIGVSGWPLNGEERGVEGEKKLWASTTQSLFSETRTNTFRTRKPSFTRKLIRKILKAEKKRKKEKKKRECKYESWKGRLSR